MTSTTENQHTGVNFMEVYELIKTGIEEATKFLDKNRKMFGCKLNIMIDSKKEFVHIGCMKDIDAPFGRRDGRAMCRHGGTAPDGPKKKACEVAQDSMYSATNPDCDDFVGLPNSPCFQYFWECKVDNFLINRTIFFEINEFLDLKIKESSDENKQMFLVLKKKLQQLKEEVCESCSSETCLARQVISSLEEQILNLETSNCAEFEKIIQETSEKKNNLLIDGFYHMSLAESKINSAKKNYRLPEIEKSDDLISKIAVKCFCGKPGLIRGKNDDGDVILCDTHCRKSEIE